MMMRVRNVYINLYQEPQDYDEFHFPLEIEFQFSDGSSIVEKVYVDKIEKKFKFEF